MHPGWRMGSSSAVADEAAHCTRRSLFERCHGLTILNFGGWVVFSAVADEATHCSPLWRVGKCHSGCFAIILGWVGFSAVAGEATHSYPHCLFVKCHSTFCTLGVIAVGEVALNVVHPGWRMGSISAVADEAAHCSQRKL